MTKEPDQIRCAFCGVWCDQFHDFVVPWYAECWECAISRYEPPKLPLWKVSAW